MKVKVHFYNKPIAELDVTRIVPNTNQTIGVYYLAGGVETYCAAEFIEL